MFLAIFNQNVKNKSMISTIRRRWSAHLIFSTFSAFARITTLMFAARPFITETTAASAGVDVRAQIVKTIKTITG
jgi:hypothetical protein